MTDIITAYSEQELLEVIYKNTMMIWNHHTGPTFWYAANVPGPFYINIEKLIGQTISSKLLQKITSVLKKNISLQKKAEYIYNEIISIYRTHDSYKRIIALLLKKYNFYDPFSYISGGERRDWFFSVPCAHELGIDHIFLFKERTCHLYQIRHQRSSFTKIIHISDLLHHGSSYFNYWIPTLEKNNFVMQDSYSVVSRGDIGINQLKSYHVNACALVTIDINFFNKLQTNRLITSEQYRELIIYFENKIIWAKKYFLPYIQSNKLSLDIKSQKRFEHFLHQDPWNLFQGPNNLLPHTKNQVTI